MHPSSKENLLRCKERYIDGLNSADQSKLKVVDIGSANVNGSYRALFESERYDYTGLDLKPGPGVDIILPHPYKYPLADNSADVVLSGQMMEHCEFFWVAFKEMVRIVKPDGYLIVIAPSAGPIHRYPVDCYRFYPDGFRALAKWTGCHVVDIWHDNRGPWNDLVGIFSKQEISADLSRHRKELAMQRQAERPVPNGPKPPAADAAAEAMAGAAPYLEALKKVHEDLNPRFYFEIGVRFGHSLALARCPAIGIDPAPEIAVELPPGAQIVKATSDAYFESSPHIGTMDFAFIDGMHLFEFVLRDFMNIERLASPTSLVALDDIFPNHVRQALRVRETRGWTGDVWKIVPCLRQARPDLILLPINTSPTGLLLIAGLAPENTALRGSYNPIVSRFLGPNFEEPTLDVFKRQDALEPGDPRIGQLLKLLSDLRNRNATRQETRRALTDYRREARLR
jgi:SAM-dependent methyltransferase